jgi:3-oxoacyl-[acyl-carrier-protein] synthase II
MNILGIGTVFAGGFGIGDFEIALCQGRQGPSHIDAKWATGGKTAVYQVNLEAVPDKSLIKKIRRSDKLSKMAVLAAAGALADSGIGDIPPNLGIILATGFGAHVTTFGFLDDILDYGDGAVSPTTFSNSVHNAAASYVASSFDIKGPTLTVTQFRFSFQSALQLAKTWIDQGRCGYVLVGAADQYGDVLGYVSDRKLTTARDGMIKPFTFNPTCQAPGEGAVFFLLGEEHREKSYCAVQSIFVNDVEAPGTADVAIIDADGLLADESAYRQMLSADTPVTAYSPLFGSMMTGSAFNVAAGALMLKRQMLYAAPVQDNPHGLRLLTESKPARIESIRCLGCGCNGEKAEIMLLRP